MSTTNRNENQNSLKTKWLNFLKVRQGGLIVFFITFVSILVFIGCNKDDVSTSNVGTIKTKIAQETVAIPTIQNGKMYFETKEALNQFTEQLTTIDDLTGFNIRLKDAGFISYFQMTQFEQPEFDALQIENQEFNDLPDPVLMTILNVNQEVKIDNIICRLEKDFGFMFEEKDRHYVSEFNSTKPTFNEEVLSFQNQIYVFRLNVKEHSLDGQRHKLWFNGYGWRDNWTNPNVGPNNGVHANINYRTRGHHWMVNLLFYQSTGVETLQEQKKYSNGFFGIGAGWSWKRQAGPNVRLNLNGTATVTYNNPYILPSNITFNSWEMKNNVSEVDHFFNYGWGITLSTGAMTIPVINVSIPFSVSGPNWPQNVTINTLTTNHNINYIDHTNPLPWIW